MRFVIVTMDNHLRGAVERAHEALRDELPGLELTLHATTEWSDPEALERCREDIERADIIIANMLFMDEHIRAVQAQLEARKQSCDALVCFMSAGEVMKLTRVGGFDMAAPQKGPLALLKKLRGSKKSSEDGGAQQMAMLRRLPKILRFIPGKAQDVRAYFLTMQFWLAGSSENVASMVRYLISRYGSGPRAALRGGLKAKDPVEYPDTGLYHPDLPRRITADVRALPRPASAQATVGLLVMRSYVLAGDTAHYDAVIRAFEARGFRVVPAFASGLDNRPAVRSFFFEDGRPAVDAVVSLTGFSLVGGPAFNDARAAEALLTEMDVPYLSAQALEFQSVERWAESVQGFLPVEATMMLAIPELDGATGPIVFGGRPGAGSAQGRHMAPIPERVSMLVARVARLVALRQAERRERKVAVVLFNFPPNGGAVGTAAHLSVFASLYRVLGALRDDGYAVEVPESVDALRAAILEGNSAQHGADANVAAWIPVEDHVRREPYLAELEAQWGAAPGVHNSDGRSIQVLGARFGNVLVGLQPAFGYEGDPMRLLFEGSFTPTHAFSAFYRYLREDFGAHAVVHFGMHGALEFMPGKQSGMSAACWPDRLIADLPNVYLYAANNPSEGTIAKRRSAATLVTYMTPPVARAGLYRGLQDLRGSILRWQTMDADAYAERLQLVELIQAQASELDLADLKPTWNGDAAERIQRLLETVVGIEETLIPHGLHVFGEPLSAEDRLEHLVASAELRTGKAPPRAAVQALCAGATPEDALTIAGIEQDPLQLEALVGLEDIHRRLLEDHELPGLLAALDGRFIPPAPGGDILTTPDSLPTGRNLHGFDPFKIPSGFAVADGLVQAQRLLDRHTAEGNGLPETVALVLWGTDNLKTAGSPIAQVLALLGARPRMDSYGRVCGASLVPLSELGRPRIDVVVTLSGIFRDLLPLQVKMLAEAVYLAAEADEPEHDNYVRKHCLAYMAAHGCDLEAAALRVFSNADGAYGANVNHLVDSGAWSEEDELAETYTRRKCFAYGREGRPTQQRELLQSVLATVELTYQNLESVELGVTTIDHYFDTLGGIGRAVCRARGDVVPVYIGDQTHGDAKVRTLAEQVALETRTRMLNPKWYEGMLEHGPEGVRQIEAHVTNTVGWSATTGQVAPWVYNQISQTYVLDPEMRERLARLNPKASVKLAQRLLEAHERQYWDPDPSTLEALRRAGDELEDRLEGLTTSTAAA
ncbi:MAG: magnesium chelatase subunit H [Myxococcales bacterium]|nr:magnesium chelatase subunit H [Myxococcales bacterium]